MASERLIVNASPLIFLSGVDGLEWLARLADNGILVPEAVVEEVAAGVGGQEIVQWIERAPPFSVVKNLPVPPIVAAWDLGPGETQVLAHCSQHPEPMAILDDKAARDCARDLGIRVVGTLGIVLVAKRHEWITQVRPIIERLLYRGMYLSTGLIEMVLRDVGEQ